MTHVPVGPFGVADLSRAAVVEEMTRLAGTPAPGGPATAFALHVGGLVARRDRAFVEAMHGADIVYADGASVVLAARAGGARSIERAPTTDIGWDLLRSLTDLRGTPPVVSAVGGLPGLAGRALQVLVDAGVAAPGVTDHGYHTGWEGTLQRLRDEPCDVLLVALGAPKEMLWVREHLDQLPQGIVVTCGGWLGFLAGEESRAPKLLQTLSLEWAYRLAHSPRRLASRYVLGAVATAAIAGRALLARWSRR